MLGVCIGMHMQAMGVHTWLHTHTHTFPGRCIAHPMNLTQGEISVLLQFNGPSVHC